MQSVTCTTSGVHSWFMAKTLRRQVPIHPAVQETLDHLRKEGSSQAQALAVLTGVSIRPDSSDAETLSAMLDVGRELIEQKALEDAYRREAEFARNHPDVQAWRRAIPHLRTSAHTQDNSAT